MLQLRAVTPDQNPVRKKKRLEKDDTHVTVYQAFIGSKNEPINATWEQGTLLSARQLAQQVRRNAVISTCTLRWGYTRAKNMATGGKSIRVVYDIRKNCRFLSCQSAELTTTLLRHLLAHYYAVIMLRRGLP